MATFTESALLAIDVGFLARVNACLAKKAVAQGNAILSARESTEPQRDKLRLIFCRAILDNSAAYAVKFAWPLSTMVTAGVLDSDLMIAVDSIWDLFTGVTI